MTGCLRKKDFPDSRQLLHREISDRDVTELLKAANETLCALRRKEVAADQRTRAFRKALVSVAHDLRTPLTSSLGYVDLLRKADLPGEEARRELEIIESRMLRLDTLIRSFFELSELNMPGEEIDRRPVNVVALLEEVVSWHYDDFLREDREILLVCDRKKCMIMSHSGMLKRVFDNLISNGLKHGTGDLRIRLKGTEQEIQVDFQNRLTENNLEISRIFDEFYTPDTSRIKGNTGLGLAIARGFIEILGYRIYASKDQEDFLTITVGIVWERN